MAKNIVIADIKKMLEDGLNRKEIVEKINSTLPEGEKLNKREITALWKHESLKGVKVAKYKNDLVFVDEVPTRPVDLSQQ